jgi:Chaperone of endosialidase
MPIALNGSTSGKVTIQAPAVAGTNTLTLPAATGNLLSDQSIVPASSSVPTNGMYLPATNALGLATNSTNAVYIDASQNVGIGTTSPATYAKLAVVGGTGNGIAYNDGTVTSYLGTSGSNLGLVGTLTNYPFAFYTNASERMRIDSSGNLLVGTTSITSQGRVSISWISASQQGITLKPTSETYNGNAILFQNSSAATAGYISQSTSSVAYNTSSDYRLKENVTPMTNGLTIIGALKPVTYNWITDKSKGEGFVAHELQAVIPLAVTGEKDAVDAEGKIKPQGVDYSKIVVHLVAALQEAVAKIDAQAADIAALKAKVGV